MIDELAQADPARHTAPTEAAGTRMDDELRRLMAAEAAGDARVGVAGDVRAGDAPVDAAGDLRAGRGGAVPARVGRPRRGRRRLVLAPVALATAALTLGVALPGGKTTAVLEPPPANAAAVLTSLRDKVAAAPAAQGRYAYLKSLSYSSHMGSGYVAVIPSEFEQWVADDGTGVTKGITHWDQATFPTPEDKVAYETQQRPPMLDDGSPRAVRDAEVLGMRLAEVRALPTDPVALKTTLENRDNVVVTAYAGALLSFAGTPHAVKVALFSVLKSLPGAKLIPSVTDPLDRAGVGVQFDDEAWRTLFLFDPDTGALLGTKSIGKKEVPGRTIEDWNLTVESGRTDSAPKTGR